MAQVFPNASHRWCIWHVMQNAKKHLGSNPKWVDILSALQDALHDSLCIEEFEEAWDAMLEKFGLRNNKWLCKMYEKRRRWVPVYFKNSFWAGMSSTQRSEGMNHFFKSFLNINITLKLFVEQYGLALSKRVREEETSNFTSINKPLRCMTDHVFELVFQELYTTAKFEEFQVEVRNLVYANALRVEDDVNVCTYVVTVKVPYFRRTRCYKYRVTLQKDNTDVKCECKNFEFRGILCTHILRVFSEENVYYVPQRYILDRWRKDLPREHLKVPVPYYKLIEKKSDGMKRYGDIHG